MRFALLVRASRESETATTPFRADADRLLRYATELTRAGVLLDAQGLQPTQGAIRVVMSREAGEPEHSTRQPASSAKSLDATVTTREKKTATFGGPFPPEETISAWWIIDVASVEEAIRWAEQSPFPLVGKAATVEIRQLFAPDDIRADKELTVEETAGSEAIQKLFRG